MFRAIPVQLVAFVFAAAPTVAFAGKHYTGAFTGTSVAVGPSILNNSEFSGRVGVATQVEARVASTLQLFDTTIFYGFATTGFSQAGVDVRFLGHGFGTTLNFHPAFLSHLGNRITHYILGGFHFGIGATGEWRTVSGGATASVFGLGWHWVLGVDIPLQNPNNHRSLWLGVRYSRFYRDVRDAGAARDLDAHVAAVRIEHRWNSFPGF
ncbi:MAG: hypothetical protein HYY84_09545 [Deltaproteobacteria bacterium]|nr:hypothetical protein [Deltaproteobacteria bacterium]